MTSTQETRTDLGMLRMSDTMFFATNRELRRVPLDFDWPVNEIWSGYLNPYWAQHIQCPDCGGTGSSPTARLYKEQWYGNEDFDPRSMGSEPYTKDTPAVLALAKRNVERAPEFYGHYAEDSILRTTVEEREAARLADHFNSWMHHLCQDDVQALVDEHRLQDFTHRPRTLEQVALLQDRRERGEPSYWLTESNGYVPTAAEVNEWSLNGMGHDSINCWVVVRARCKREGVATQCERCAGEGHSIPEGIKDLYENWTQTAPPVGDAYQLWETCSEGSPMSPPFATLEELAEYAAPNCTIFGTSNFLSKEGWLARFRGDEQADPEI